MHRGPGPLRRFFVRFLTIGVVVLVAVQFVPVERSNPPVETEVPAPVEVRDVLRRACYDCHSHETVWPWYARVAPVSWLVSHDVEEGREHLNFSTWNRFDVDERAELRREVWEEVEAGEMPLPIYLRLHPDARLSEVERVRLRGWSRAAPVDPEPPTGPADRRDGDADRSPSGRP